VSIIKLGKSNKGKDSIMYKLCKSDGKYKTGDTVKLRAITVNTNAEFKLSIFKGHTKNDMRPVYAYQGKVIKPDLTAGYQLGELYGLPVNSFYKL
jgi:hypothetical protein